MSAPPTHCKLSTETISVGEGSFGHVKVGHLNSLDLQCAVKERKKEIIFSASLWS